MKEMIPTVQAERAAITKPATGLAVWILERLRREPRAETRLALLERISLAPRQSLALVEADGRRLLVATSPDGAPVFYALDDPELPGRQRRRSAAVSPTRRISW